MEQEDLRDMKDSSHYFDELNDSFVNRSEADKAKRLRLKQKKIDDAHVALLVKALESGVRLKGDPIYEEMI